MPISMDLVIKNLPIPDEIRKSTEFSVDEIELSTELSDIYGGNFFWPTATDKQPGIIGNFVTTRDGFVSYNIPGRLHAGFISEGNPGDRFIMGLTRTLVSVDKSGSRGAIMNGANTLNVEKNVVMTAAGIYSEAMPLYRNYLEKKIGQPFKMHQSFLLQGAGDWN